MDEEKRKRIINILGEIEKDSSNKVIGCIYGSVEDCIYCKAFNDLNNELWQKRFEWLRKEIEDSKSPDGDYPDANCVFEMINEAQIKELS